MFKQADMISQVKKFEVTENKSLVKSDFFPHGDSCHYWYKYCQNSIKKYCRSQILFFRTVKSVKSSKILFFSSPSPNALILFPHPHKEGGGMFNFIHACSHLVARLCWKCVNGLCAKRRLKWMSVTFKGFTWKERRICRTLVYIHIFT